MANVLKPFSYRIFASFERADDRLTATYNPGRFFIFNYFFGQFEVKVTDAQWSSPPNVGAQVWIVGRIFSNRFGGVTLHADDFFEPSERHPAPDELEQIQGGQFSGIAKVMRATYTSKTGGQGYKLTLGAMGLLYNRHIDVDLYETTPHDVVAVVSGRLEFRTLYTAKNPNGSVVCELLPDNYKTATFGRQAPTPNKKQTDENK